MNGVQADFFKALKDCDSAEAYYLAQQITRTIDKNKFNLYFDKNGDLTSLGELAAALFETIFVYGVLKKEGRTADERLS